MPAPATLNYRRWRAHSCATAQPGLYQSRSENLGRAAPGRRGRRELLHGSVAADSRTFLVAAIDHTTGMVLGQRQVADKRGESTAIEPLLSGLPTGVVWTLDALHTSKKTARLITGPLRGHYILFLKANQPLALQAAQALLSGTDIEFAGGIHADVDRGHGRTGRRTICVADCENRLHYVRDVTFREDASQVRTGNAPRTTATFRNLSVNTIRYAGRANIAHARRDLRNHADVFAVYGI